MAATYDIPQTQKAAVTISYSEPVSIQTDYPVPQPSSLEPGQVIVKLNCTGICHSDLHIVRGEWVHRPLPFVGGHEGVGIIVAVAPGTRESDDVRLGSRVGVKWILTSCGRCEFCRTGRDSVCAKAPRTGMLVDGTFQEYMVAWSDHLVPIPEGMSDEAAVPILCAGLTVYKGLKVSETKVGDWIVIPGAGGGLGHLAIQYAVAMGLRVIAVDTGDDKKDACTKLGAEKWIDFKTSKNLVEDVVAASGAPGPHAALITTPSSAAYDAAVLYLRPFGTLAAIGLPPKTGPGSTFQTPIFAIVSKCLRIQGSVLGNLQDAVEALDLVARGKVHASTIPCKLEDLNQTYADMLDGKLVGRAMVRF
ncbi:unnamed protein product [Peniophora sp. CBMAI 1063]|nr:unnamed protein product [Peniophora sp. CBMAI 1063]